MIRRIALAAPVLVAGLGITSVAYGASFDASDAKLKGSQLTFNVTSPEEGWAVIHLDNGGKPGDHIGYAKIQKGKNSKVSTALARKVEKGEPLIVMLHDDKGRPDVFEFGAEGKADKPAMDNGKPIMDEITPE